MSKQMQIGVIVLFVLLVGSAGIAAVFFLQNQKITAENQTFQNQLQEYKNKEADLLSRAKKLEKDQEDLNNKINQKEKERDQAQQAYDGLKAKVDDLNDKIAQAGQDRDDYKGRVDTIRRERDELMEKLKNQKEKIVEKIVEKIIYKDRETPSSDMANGEAKEEDSQDPTFDQGERQGDQYWANVLKERESLKLDLSKAQSELDQSMLQVVELKKQNSDIQIQLKNLTDLKEDLEKKLSRDREELESQLVNEKKELERKAHYSEDLANSLSLEVARARTIQKDSEERAEKYKKDSIELQEQIKQLNETKLALERTISQINQDKGSMQKRLAQTEGAIQGRIDEIWKIKQNLDQKISQLPTSESSVSGKSSNKAVSREVELSPIVVNPSSGAGYKEKPRTQVSSERKKPAPVTESVKDQGAIISINEPNNFVIVDLGENDGSQVGRKLTVYRENTAVGSLEIIQVRKDISAADIKESRGALRVGDIVRYN